MTFLALRSLSKTFADGTPAVRGVDLEVNEGEFIVLLGPSGCGKTTTLRMVAGLETASAGAIVLDGRDVTALRPSERDVGFVFQFYALYPHLTVLENIAFPLRSTGTPAAAARGAARELAARLGLADLLARHPRELSGGDQQRVALARAMVRTPRLFLMDEPLGTLDADRRLESAEFLRARQLESATTTLYVTHDQEEALHLADRIVVMESGRVRQIGTPSEIYDHPADLFVARFVGSPGMNFIEGRVQPSGASLAFAPAAGGEPLPLPALSAPLPEGPLLLGVRPEHLRPDPAGPLRAKVRIDEYLGAWRNLHLETPIGPLIARDSAGPSPSTGEELGLTLDPAHARLFDPTSGLRLA